MGRILRRSVFSCPRLHLGLHNNTGLYACVFGLYFVTFVIVLPLLCRDYAYSSFYSGSTSMEEETEKVMELNDRRLQEAKVALRGYHNEKDVAMVKGSSKIPQRSNTEVDVAIGMVSVPRHSPDPRRELRYLTQTFVKLQQSVRAHALGRRGVDAQPVEVRSSRFRTKALFICNVHAGPGNHTEALEDLGSLVQVHSRFPTNDPEAVIMDPFDKERADYVFCIDAALSYQPKYVLMIEDDVLPQEDLFAVLDSVIGRLVEGRYPHRGDDVMKGGPITTTTNPWALLKLYYPEKWQGFSWNVMSALELCGMGTLGGSSFVFFGFLTPIRLTFLRGRTRNPRLFVTGFLYGILVTWTVGRQYLIEWRRISAATYTVVPAPDCCTPAILYPADKAAQLSEFLQTMHCTGEFPIDFALDRFVKERAFEKHLVEPNLMQHIGFVSSLKTRVNRPQDFMQR